MHNTRPSMHYRLHWTQNPSVIVCNVHKWKPCLMRIGIFLIQCKVSSMIFIYFIHVILNLYLSWKYDLKICSRTFCGFFAQRFLNYAKVKCLWAKKPQKVCEQIFRSFFQLRYTTFQPWKHKLAKDEKKSNMYKLV